MEVAYSRFFCPSNINITEVKEVKILATVGSPSILQVPGCEAYKQCYEVNKTALFKFGLSLFLSCRFLSVKKWLLRKKHQIELARKRGWKGYWVCLKGTTLLFYPCDSREGRSVEAAPKHLIIVDGAIMQPIPEHPKRDYIFCLSTAFGDAYLFQVGSEITVGFPVIY